MELSVGQTFEDYEILGILGSGGMGKVYQVRNKISNRVEAMKVLLSDLNSQPELVDRFTREIRIFASLDHPNIAELRTALRVDNQLVMIMEYVAGPTLDALMKLGRVPPEKYLDYMCQALTALSYAHSKGVVHRDIKPANMILTPSGILKLMDFGIAKAASDPKLTRTGMVVGSVYYVSPEQIEGKDLDGRSDLYSLGVTLYELATGKRPFEGKSDYAIISARMKETPPPPRELDASIPPDLSDVIMLALERDPARRFQTAEAFKNALTSVLAGLRPAQQAAALPPITPSPAMAARRNTRLLYMLAGSAATIAVIALAIVEVPKLVHTSAAPAPRAAQSSGGPQQVPPAPAPAAPAPQPASESPAPVSTPRPSPPAEPAPTEAAPPAQPAAQTVGTGGSKTKTSVAAIPRQASPRERGQTAPPVTAQAPIASQGVPSPGAPPPGAPQPGTLQPGAPPPAQAVPPAAPAKAPVKAHADAAALADLRERANLMSVRIGTIRTSFQALQRQQGARGLSPRSDMVAADQRLGYQWEQAEASLQQGDMPEAKKRLDAAERDLERLESFLGK